MSRQLLHFCLLLHQWPAQKNISTQAYTKKNWMNRNKHRNKYSISAAYKFELKKFFQKIMIQQLDIESGDVLTNRRTKM